MQKFRQNAVIAAFFLLLLSVLAAWLLTPDREISRAERRRLAQAPELSAGAVFSGEYAAELEEYLLDQFPLRDAFRSLKARLRFGLFRQRDNNRVYLAEGQVSRLDGSLREEQVTYAGRKLASLWSSELRECPVWCAVVPDKNCYLAVRNGYPALDYARMLELFRMELPEAVQEIDLFSLLTAGDYYRTDAHWRQERLFPVAQALCSAMGSAEELLPETAFAPEIMEPFYGVYCGQSALPVGADQLVVLHSEATDRAAVPELGRVYLPERFEGMDGYDVFLGGAQALVTMELPEAQTERELVIFRDSFASSLAPLLLGAYRKITLVDLRYLPADAVGEFVDFHGQDVLFLYSTTILNSGMLLK